MITVKRTDSLGFTQRLLLDFIVGLKKNITYLGQMIRMENLNSNVRRKKLCMVYSPLIATVTKIEDLNSGVAVLYTH
jgi:predicted aconitase